jgi:predicted ribosomally synthesized peptide with SipW-like signal peptide
MDDRIELTRRKALAGLATVGVAGAGAGLGTSALFNDEESFDDNLLSAGTLNLKVEVEVPATSDDFGQVNATFPGDDTVDITDGDTYTLDGDDSTGGDITFELTDVKPGDWWVVCTTVIVEGNPGYVTVNANDVTQTGGDNPEPEGTPDDGELGANLMVYQGDGFDSPSDEITYAGQTSTLEFEGTLDEFLRALGYDAPWDGLTYENPASQPFSGTIPPGHGDPRAPHYPTVVGPDPATTYADTTAVTHYTKYEIPESVGNVIQGDTITYDIEWRTEQARNNTAGIVPRSGLVGHYPLDSVGDGVADDISGNDNDGTVQGGVSPVAGQVGDAGSFDGVDDHVTVPDDPSLDLTDAVTLAAWVKPSSSQDDYARIISREQGGVGNRQYNLGIDSTASDPRTVVDTVGPNTVEVSAMVSFTDDEWHHAAMAFDASDALRLYVDGTEEDSTPVSSPLVSRASTVKFGAPAHLPGKDRFAGRIDDVRIYDRALSDSEMTALYDATK